MTNMTRSSTLSLRRPAAAALTTSRPARSVTTAPAERQPGSSGNAVQTAESSERVLRSDALLQGRSHVSIMHNGETYQLRATRLGKLILTK
ncbi:hemin uptake protein HemP [Paraburkholderia sp. Tr-20389]|uniref:hemin uptake protein HemP n=1 Tax=Paraburkholderia sp. Tr-20389 TaxID=2703903 RepID=UPI001981640A|nr:hemin uptake protein HemP [Paraburkholderia sp. Tr-20389]MBN3754701.1 hemin uptake protein HemP [Paraburkholderia sp. Tr-20389]